MQTAVRQARLVDPILAEISQEAEITKRLLNVVPENKLSWRPHPKARSLGELALHVANSQGNVAQLAQADSKEAGFSPELEASSRAEILQAFEESLQKTREIVEATADDRATADWSLTKNGQTILTMPRINLWRSIMMNHIYHHRGQLSVYLRQLDVLLPSIYGPSADTDPFNQ